MHQTCNVGGTDKKMRLAIGVAAVAYALLANTDALKRGAAPPVPSPQLRSLQRFLVTVLLMRQWGLTLATRRYRKVLSHPTHRCNHLPHSLTVHHAAHADMHDRHADYRNDGQQADDGQNYCKHFQY